MKKPYIHPQAEVVEITTTRMIAVSSFGGELNSPSFDFMDNDGLLEQLSNEASSTLFDDDIIDAETFLGE